MDYTELVQSNVSLNTENAALIKQNDELRKKVNKAERVFIFQRSVANGESEEVKCQKVFNSLALASMEIGAHLRVREINSESAPNKWEIKYDERLDAHVKEFRTGYCGYVSYRIICTHVHNDYF